jgi:hypothetical protein
MLPTQAQKGNNNAAPHIHIYINSVARVHEQTIPTEWLPLVGEVSANFADRGV